MLRVGGIVLSREEHTILFSNIKGSSLKTYTHALYDLYLGLCIHIYNVTIIFKKTPWIWNRTLSGIYNNLGEEGSDIIILISKVKEKLLNSLRTVYKFYKDWIVVLVYH